MRGGRSGSSGPRDPPMYRRRINVSEEKWRLRNLHPGLWAMMVSTIPLNPLRPHSITSPQKHTGIALRCSVATTLFAHHDLACLTFSFAVLGMRAHQLE